MKKCKGHKERGGTMEGCNEIMAVKPNGKCTYCNAQLKIQKNDHNYIKTKGYTKYYGGEKAVIRCPKCKREQFVTLN